jgi:hypothetical protein
MMLPAMIGGECSRFRWSPIHDLIVVELEIDDPVLPEASDLRAGFGVERDHLVAGRDVHDACLLAVAPVGESAPRKAARRRFAALALVQVVHPQHLAGCGIERHDGSARPAVV